MIRISKRCKGTLAALVLACAGVSAVLLTAAPAGAGVTTYTATADAFTASDLPGTVENTSYVSQDGSPSRYGYYEFTVAVPAGELITSAVFQCWAGSSNSVGMGLWTAASTWSETTLTWNNAPQANFALPASGSTGAVTSGRYNPADVTSAITGGGTFTLVGKTTSSTQWSCASKENTGNHPPQLVVTTTPAPPPTSSTPPPTSSSPPPVHTDTALPARGAFSYDWYPETWGSPPRTRYNPTLGFYDSTAVAASHVASMNYGGFAFDVSSWWGQGSATDGRTQNLLNAAHGTPLKIAAYYEAEGNTVAGVTGSPNPTSAQITADLNYLAARYVPDPNYMFIAGKPVVFAFGDASDSCAMNDRWTAANAAATQPFYVVLKVFGGYAACANQPANWHQYGPATRVDQQGTHSYSLSPGYNKWSDPAPLLARDPAGWPAAVQAMNCAAVDLRLVTTFNEWGEGTAVESAAEWSSASGQGTYLDALHADQSCGPPATTTAATSSPATTTPATSSPPPTTTPPPPPPSGVPVYDHVFYVMFENHNYSDIIGSPNAPYLNSLTVSGGLATNYHAVTHPSVNNYLAAVSGQTYSGITDNCTVGSGTCHTGAANLADGVEAAGRTWKGYMETMPSPCYGPHDAGVYTERHNPFPYFDQIRTNAGRCARIVPYTQLATDLASAATTPSFAWVTPNLCNDMHNACAPSNAVTNGDNWAKAEFPKIFASQAWKTQHCLLVINEDENGGAAGNQVPAIFVSSDGTVVAGKRSATNYTHYSLLRTIEASWSIPPVGPGDAAASPMLDMFGP